jgi:MutS domain V
VSATTTARPDPRAEYTRRLEDRQAAIRRSERRALLLSNGRLLVAGIAAVVFWGAVYRGAWSPFWLVLPGAAFAALAVAHARLLQAEERVRRGHAFYAHGLRRMDGTWASAAATRGGASGSLAPAESPSPFEADLDLFGPASLFQLLNTARTEIGESTLSEWLRTPATPDEISLRQAAVAELRELMEFREAIVVLAAEAEVGRTQTLAAWAREQPAAFRPAVPVLFAASSIVTVALAAAVYVDRIELAWLGAWVLLQSAFAMVWSKRLERIVAAVGTPEHDLNLLSALLEQIERQPFSSDRLIALRDSLKSDGAPPSARIRDLRRLVSAIDATFNLLFAPIAYIVLLRQQLAMAVDRWHQRHRAAVLEWLRRAGEIEALAALATFSYEHPDDPFPSVVVDARAFEAVGLAHPLMPEAAAVRNDVMLGRSHPRVLIVSGSNMSGKSTLLRAVGVNVVLALAGATVRATQLTVSPLALGATIRVDDSLQEGRSRFYAEILRIRDIVSRASIEPTLFLLDEILHGTNSYDRRIGAEAIVTALVSRGAIGLVTTHDLALTELVDRLDGAAANVHFEDRLDQGRMAFDYRMRPGVVTHSNALALMRAIGLDV